jgi:hypothetical protein
VQQRNLHRVVATLKPQFKSFVAHFSSLSQRVRLSRCARPVAIKA